MIRNLRLGDIKPGVVVGRDIFSNTGNLLTERGTVVTPDLLAQFDKWGMNFVPIELADVPATPLPARAPLPGQIAPEQTSRVTMSLQQGQELKHHTLSMTEQILDNMRLRKTIDRDRTKQLVGKLVGESSDNREILATLLQVRQFDNYLFNHSLNVSVLAILVGQMLKVSEKQLYLLGEAALLHDVGMTAIPEAVWNKEGALTDEERFQIQKHPILSADIIEKMAVAEPDLVKAVYQHHEREDGTGYPKGLDAKQIHDLAKILAVVDVYDAMTNPRAYRENFAPYQTVKTILTLTNRSLNQEVVRAFVAEMSLYPVGSVVRVNTGVTGIVIRSSRSAPLRPMLKLVRDEQGRPFPDEVYVDLVTERSLFITESVFDRGLVNELLSPAGGTR